MTTGQFGEIDSKEIKLRGWKDRYAKLNGKFKTTLVILLIILLGGAYAFFKNETERARAVQSVRDAQRVADSVAMEKTKIIIQEAIWPLVLRVRELESGNSYPATKEERFDTTLIYEQLEQKPKEENQWKK